MAIFTGAGVAIITPFHEDGSVNYEKFAEHIEAQIAGGTDAIVVCGTTGEASTLTHEEHLEVIRFCVEKTAGRIPVIAGTGSNCTETAVYLSQEAEKAGVDGVLLVTPYYNKATQKGLYEHFRIIAESIHIPVILYNIPGRTGVNMLPDTIAKLSRHEKIVAVKEAAGSLEQVSQIRQTAEEGFEIYSGDDSLTLPMLSVGAEGVISVASHILGSDINKMCTEFFKGNVKEAETLHKKLYELFKVLFITSNPVPVKYALGKVWKDVGGVRLPLFEMGDAEKAKVDAVLEKLGLI